MDPITGEKHVFKRGGKRVLTPPPKQHRPGAKYVSRRGQEYIIRQDGNFWVIRRWGGGNMAKELFSKFLTHRQAEEALVNYLRRTDKFGKAIYPGCAQ